MLSLKEPPLKERVFTSSGDKPLPTQVHSYKEWSSHGMAQAMKAVIEEGLSIRRAAERYGIPKSTLGDRISGRVLPGSVSGPPKILTDKEENDLEQFLFHCSAIGYGKTRKDVVSLVERLLCYRGTQKSVSNGWWSSFMKRHPNVVLRTPSTLGRARYLATNRGMIDKYFDLLEDTISKFHLNDKPCQIFNIDESGFPLSPQPPKTLCRRGTKTPSVFSSSNRSQITVVGCVSASGQAIPPMVIWDWFLNLLTGNHIWSIQQRVDRHGIIRHMV